MAVDNVILLASWLTSLGLLGVIIVHHAQAEAAKENLVNEWTLSRCEARLRSIAGAGQ
jgi:hypothetical protein